MIMMLLVGSLMILVLVVVVVVRLMDVCVCELCFFLWLVSSNVFIVVVYLGCDVVSIG